MRAQSSDTSLIAYQISAYRLATTQFNEQSTSTLTTLTSEQGEYHQPCAQLK